MRQGLIWRAHHMSEAQARAAIVAEARTWVGTRWAHAHDLKGGGVDCAMLLVRVFVDCKVLSPFDPRPYPAEWFQHRDAARFSEFLERFAAPVERTSPGDVCLYNFGKHSAHGAIVIDEASMVHAYLPARRVILDSINSLQGRRDSCWSVFA